MISLFLSYYVHTYISVIDRVSRFSIGRRLKSGCESAYVSFPLLILGLGKAGPSNVHTARVNCLCMCVMHEKCSHVCIHILDMSCERHMSVSVVGLSFNERLKSILYRRNDMYQKGTG